MAKTLAQIQKQIDALQKEAANIKTKEIPGVVSRIKDAIRHYGLTAADLGFKGGAAPKAGNPAGKAKTKGTSAAKYADGAGNTWSGRGPRPGWIKAALAQGKALTDFSNGSTDAGPGGGTTIVGGGRKPNPATKPKAKYTDGADKTWSGRGPKPGWVKEALAQGKQLTDLLVK